MTVSDLLAQLGETADEIADRFRALNIKGRQSQPGCCPVAIYLFREGVERPLVDDCDVLFTQGHAKAIVSNPQPVREFIHRFDEGVYLDLVEVTNV